MGDYYSMSFRYLGWRDTLRVALARLYDLSGARFVANKFFPGRDPVAVTCSPPPSSGMLWLVGVYTALFGLASSRYEAALDRMVNRQSAIFAQVDAGSDYIALQRIADAQAMVRPQRPEILEPLSVVMSLLGADERDPIIVAELADAVATYGTHLAGLDLGSVALNDVVFGELPDTQVWHYDDYDVCADNLLDSAPAWSKVRAVNMRLKGAVVDHSAWRRADIRDSEVFYSTARDVEFVLSNLSRAKFLASDLEEAYFSATCLRRAVFGFARLAGATFSNVDLAGAKFTGSNLSGATFRNCEGLTQAQLDSAFVDRGTPANIPDGYAQPPTRILNGGRRLITRSWREALTQPYQPSPARARMERVLSDQ